MQYTEMTESALLVRATTGDEQAFAALIQACQGTLYAVAMTLTHNHQDAMDAMQEGILKAWHKLPGFRAQAQFSTWVTRIVIHCAIDMNRRKKPVLPLMEDGSWVSSDGDHARRMDVRRAVEGLDEKTRLCTVLYYFEDMAIDEIARVLGTRQGTVKSRLFRARTQLKDVLEDYRNEE